MKGYILNIHGFASGPGKKFSDLQEAFPNYKVICPQLPLDPLEAIKVLEEIVEELKGKELHIVGTSLGGFYTMILSTKYSAYDNIYYYAINPAYIPQEVLCQYVGTGFQNYKTRETLTFTQTMLDNVTILSQQLQSDLKKEAVIMSTYFIGSRDEILGFETLREHISDLKCPYKIKVDNQDHRYSDLSLVIQEIKANSVL